MITKITTHVAEALDNLVELFKEKPKLASTITAFVGQVQDIEDALQQLLTDRGIDAALGAQLDGLGSIVGAARQGRTDDEIYRQAIKARIGINTSIATGESILEVLFLFDGDQYELTEYFPAYFEAEKLSALAGDPYAYLALLQGLSAAGVGVGFHYSSVELDHVFTFSDDDTEQTSVNMGFADDAETIGGFFSDVVR
jgi:hypothetical protein